MVTRLPIQKNNDTKMLADSFIKIPDAISVFGDDHQVSLMQSEKQVRLERLASVFPYLITTESLAIANCQDFLTHLYTAAIFQGTEIHKKQVQKYVSCQKDQRQKYRIRSILGSRQDGQKLVSYLDGNEINPQETSLLPTGYTGCNPYGVYLIDPFVTPPGFASTR
jgi:hypothetical protein